MTISALDAAVVEGADLVLRECGRLRSGESVAVVCDRTTAEMGRLLSDRARTQGGVVRLLEIEPLDMHGQEPPAVVAEAFLAAKLCLGITAKSMAHTRARIVATRAGARYLSLPDYSLDLLADPCLRADYAVCAARARRAADALDGARLIRATTAAGTDIVMDASGRKANCCPGFVQGPGELGSPPDVESNVSPIEESAEGVVVVDGSIPYPGLGLLKEPVRLHVRGGSIVRMEGPSGVVIRLEELFSKYGPKAKVFAECGVGLNDRARLTGVMLTDEGSAGTMHFGFGSNATVGGVNDVAFHLDFVFLRPTLVADTTVILEEGRFAL